ncbi:Uncharacterised protein [Buttiauxella agrestis]|uniref:Uncharacterized protein n=1 Tax=Buttiauxella agrestis TaxID=82977 RepID=A0A381KMV6_9ENTR|nr:Uncharacterised protein [Buttiauxella agrestis]
MMDNMTNWRTETRNIYFSEFKLHVIGLHPNLEPTWLK